MLLLALFGCLRHGLVQSLDTRLERCDLLHQGRDVLLGGLDVVVLVGDRALQGLLLVVSGIQALDAVLLLLLILRPFLLQHVDHAVAHRDHLLKAALREGLLAAEGQHEEAQARARPGARRLPRAPDLGHGLGPHGRHRRAQLQEAGRGAREGLGKYIKGFVVTQDLDRVRQGHELLAPRLRALLPLGLLGRAALLQVGGKLPVLGQARLSVGQVLLHVHDAHPQFANLLCLCFDGHGERCHLLLLGRHEAFVVLDGGRLRGCGFRKVLGHGLLKLRQDSRYLARLGRVALCLHAPRQEGNELLPVHVQHVLLASDQPAEDLCCACLKEAGSHTLPQAGNGLLRGRDVRLALPPLLRVGRGLLLTDCRRLFHGCFGRAPVVLRLLEALLGLFQLALGRFEVGRDDGYHLLCGGDAGLQVTGALLTVALKLLKQLGLFFAFLLHFLLH
mmetsp:Transcript_32823/g.94081  ORF Transcript_32823/g.94081 Transcript_32823/m.94081 type:complete len:447 (+) Transcript_32823:806-2146(+)